MKVWNQAPLVRLIIPFLSGIICAVYCPFQSPLILSFLCLLLVLTAAIVLIPAFSVSYRRSYWFGFLITISLFLFAYQLTIYKTGKFSSDHYSKYTGKDQLVYARLSDPFIEKERSLKTVLHILAVNRDGIWKQTSGKTMVYFKKDECSLKLKYGDELLMRVNFKAVAGPQNPAEFNYRRFLSFHNIYEQAYVNADEWKNLNKNSGAFILNYSFTLRDKLLEILKANHVEDDEFSVGAALMLGYTDKLDADIISAYSSTGALHVLSVSGLHVAIVYIVFGWFLVFLDKVKKGHVIKAVLLILFLWFYAVLTGLSPSVLRAATMFSFIIAAKAFKKHTNIYNILAASAFFLLLIDPYLVMEVGFQLSYLAVIGIVYIQPKIAVGFEPDNRILNQIWAITTVSIAAQIATFPLGLHYFHQFPNYFLLSNLIVIPVSTLIIYFGIAVFTFSSIPVFIKYIAMAFSGLIWFLNFSVKWIESFPYSLLEGISISVSETWIIYAIIILFFCFFMIRKYNYLVYSLSLTIILLSMQIIEQYKQQNQHKLIVYNVPKTSAIDLVSGKSTILYTNTLFAKDERKLLFHVRHNWWELGLNKQRIISENIRTADAYVQDNYIRFADKRIAIWNKMYPVKNSGRKLLKLDYLILSNNSKATIAEILKLYEAKTIVLDSSNQEYKIEKWKRECRELHQEFYSVPDNGAFVQNL